MAQQGIIKSDIDKNARRHNVTAIKVNIVHVRIGRSRRDGKSTSYVGCSERRYSQEIH